uniref:Uncharacterized protein n=1 Tax=Arundo donax TaxID=35708 RepID=A0A0A9G9X7_ARUDO
MRMRMKMRRAKKNLILKCSNSWLRLEEMLQESTTSSRRRDSLSRT